MEPPNEQDGFDRKNGVNAEYLPTKCRITKPPPPKPATNPLQFIKVAPCPLFQKAHEQIKKVDEIKKERKEVLEETEDWQQNLDSWKSSRRKRQEHIIERVVEVKKMEQEQEKSKKRSKTFNEMIEDRNKGRHKISIPIFEDDSNDLSDYGIGSSSSKTNSIKEADTDDSSSLLDDGLDLQFTKETSTVLNHSQSKNETNFVLDKSKDNKQVLQKELNQSSPERKNYFSNMDVDNCSTKLIIHNDKAKIKDLEIIKGSTVEQFTYEGAIQDYCSRIQSKINVDESIFTKKNIKPEAKTVLPKGEISKRKEIFEGDKTSSCEIINKTEVLQTTLTIKDRLKSFEKLNSTTTKESKIVSINQKLQNLDLKQNIEDTENNNKTSNKYTSGNSCQSPEPIPFYQQRSPPCPVTEFYIHNVNNINRDLDFDNNLTPINIVPSTSSIEQEHTEGSGIHTADVFCSVSQTDEPADVESMCIQKLQDESHPILNTAKSDILSFANKHETVVPIDLFSSECPFSDPFVLSVPQLEPPKVKPPPPPQMDSTKRIKKELHLKRSSFFGLDESIELEDDDMVKSMPLKNAVVKKLKEENVLKQLSKVDSQDSGLDIDRGRLSSDTWCSSIGDFSTPSSERLDSEQTNSITSEEEEINKKEREIIEQVEKEEKSRDGIPDYRSHPTVQKEVLHFGAIASADARNKLHNTYSMQTNAFLDQPIRKVCEEEKTHLDQEHIQKNILLNENNSKSCFHNNHHSMENICCGIPKYVSESFDYRQSMPELQHQEHHAFVSYSSAVDQQYRKSMSDIQQSKHDRQASLEQNCSERLVDYRKSMPELQPVVFNHQPIMPGKPLRPNSSDNLGANARRKSFILDSRSQILPKNNAPSKSYNQHWLFQEAELRRLSDQKNRHQPKNWGVTRQEKHLPDSIIQSLTQRVQNRTNIIDRNLKPLRFDKPADCILPHYNKNSSTIGQVRTYPPKLDEGSQDRMLSVSGKKKCSYCNKELGRGAAMIIESLCLFYHMECFKCCVCHTQLSNGLMGTDVRVRNQKLHCHNCYSSDDGIKFSCV